MKLLVISNNTDRASFRQRIAVHIDTLRANGIAPEVAQLPRWILSRRKLFMKAKDFDAVFLHKKTLNPFDAYYLKKYGKKIIYDFDDAIMYDDNRPDKPSRKRLRDFRRTVELADLVIAGNTYLAEHARKFNPNFSILPTGLDLAAYKVKTEPNNDDKIRLVWIGSQATLPYLRQIRPALEDVGKHFGNVVLRIICDEFFDLESMQVDKRRWSQQTQARDLVECDIGLAPLPDNPFARGKCGFKILQYSAASLPVVASPVGLNAELVRDGVNGFHAEILEGWIEKISALVMNESTRIQMGREARQMVRPFDSNVIGRQLVSLVEKTIHNQSVIDGRNI